MLLDDATLDNSGLSSSSVSLSDVPSNSPGTSDSANSMSISFGSSSDADAGGGGGGFFTGAESAIASPDASPTASVWASVHSTTTTLDPDAVATAAAPFATAYGVQDVGADDEAEAGEALLCSESLDSPSSFTGDASSSSSSASSSSPSSPPPSSPLTDSRSHLLPDSRLLDNDNDTGNGSGHTAAASTAATAEEAAAEAVEEKSEKKENENEALVEPSMESPTKKKKTEQVPAVEVVATDNTDGAVPVEKRYAP
jgi:hypothetical protein